MLGGLRHVSRTPALRALVIALGAAVLVIGFTQTLNFAIVSDGLHRSPAFVGFLVSAQGRGRDRGGPDGGQGDQATGRRAGRDDRHRRRRAGGGRSISLPTLPPCVVAASLSAAGICWSTVGMVTMVQRRTPAGLQGRALTATMGIVSAPQTISIALGAAPVARRELPDPARHRRLRNWPERVLAGPPARQGPDRWAGGLPSGPGPAQAGLPNRRVHSWNCRPFRTLNLSVPPVADDDRAFLGPASEAELAEAQMDEAERGFATIPPVPAGHRGSRSRRRRPGRDGSSSDHCGNSAGTANRQQNWPSSAVISGIGDRAIMTSPSGSRSRKPAGKSPTSSRLTRQSMTRWTRHSVAVVGDVVEAAEVPEPQPARIPEM